MGTKLFYFAKKMRELRFNVFADMIDRIIRIIFGCEIHSSMKIGGGILAHNCCGTVINKEAVIGSGVTIFQNVTIGGRKGSGAPIIGDNVLIGAGAVILGDVKIGNNAQIGANAVVIKDVPENATVVGVPARFIIS